jgi:ADP-heptose:LPS heptosyltransferase
MLNAQGGNAKSRGIRFRGKRVRQYTNHQSPIINQKLLLYWRVTCRFWREVLGWELLRLRPWCAWRRRKDFWLGQKDTGVHRIMVVQLADIGDVVLTGPFVNQLRELYPTAEITVISAPHTVALWRLCPSVYRVVSFDFKAAAGARWKMKTPGCRAWWEAGKQLREIWGRSGAPDVAISARIQQDVVQVASYILLATSRAKVCLAYPMQKKLMGFLRSEKILDIQVSPKNQGHEIEQQLRLLEPLGGVMPSPIVLQNWSDEFSQGQAQGLWKVLKQNQIRWVGLGIGAGRLEKVWPLGHFTGLAQKLLENTGYGVIVIGGEQDRASGEHLQSVLREPRCINLTGRLSLEVTAAFMTGLDLFIGNDSGPMHLAAAAGVPVVGIFGPEDPQRWGPWAKRAKTVRRIPVAAVTVEEIWHEIQPWIATWK